ncbi:Inner membrane protein ydgC [Leclercia adecarboxylata]|uniref:Inner membrane protein ydgC n=1 Tax=Leclercia adecarboxylata TaxID=83655 RepID=A0A4U9HXY2_9ENTR|nr:Inner membrane protein ydgC [Leclercia adecarboxylata]
MLPLFPTFALIAHYIVASERGIEALRTTIIFGMWAIIPYFLYLLSLWYFIGMMRLPLALGGGGGLLVLQRLGVNLLLEPFSLT